jgi:hypothetical protein
MEHRYFPVFARTHRRNVPLPSIVTISWHICQTHNMAQNGKFDIFLLRMTKYVWFSMVFFPVIHVLASGSLYVSIGH